MKHQNLYLFYFFCGFPHTSAILLFYVHSGTICIAVGRNSRSAVENDHIIVDSLKCMTCIESCCKE